jgi:methionine sulfoxide reductase catalytic subunit
MHVIRRRGWELPESSATPEQILFNRRAFLGAAAGAAAASMLPGSARAQRIADLPDPTASLYPIKRNEAYMLDRPLTDEKVNGAYNNFYEFGTSKNVTKAAQALKLRPWTVKIDGMVEKPQEIGIDDLLKKMPLEERLYRHRCVEAWSMTIPWSGFALAELVKLAQPLSSAKYLRMETFLDPAAAPAQRQTFYPWPYVEGLTIAEATNELAFLAIGTYGHPMPKQHGAPLRLAVPWKYGFKSVKSIVRFNFTDQRPKTYWEALQEAEYGFWANVNPEVSHPRWSQASEELIGLGGERRPTLLFNGYGEQVAHLYTGLERERLWV